MRYVLSFRIERQELGGLNTPINRSVDGWVRGVFWPRIWEVATRVDLTLGIHPWDTEVLIVSHAG